MDAGQKRTCVGFYSIYCILTANPKLHQEDIAVKDHLNNFKTIFWSLWNWFRFVHFNGDPA